MTRNPEDPEESYRRDRSTLRVVGGCTLLLTGITTFVLYNYVFRPINQYFTQGLPAPTVEIIQKASREYHLNQIRNSLRTLPIEQVRTISESYKQ